MCWAKYNYYKDQRIENQYIWYNSRIKIGGKVFLWSQAYRRGLKYVYQLFEGQTLKQPRQVQEEFGISVIGYNSLITALPREWKEFFMSEHVGTYLPVPPHEYDNCITGYRKSVTRIVYQFLLEDVMLLHYKYMKWRSDLGPEFCEGLYDFGREHAKIYTVTNIPKYRSFQYRLYQRALVTNIQLYKWGLKANDLCHYCGDETETILHLMWSCKESQKLWESVINYLYERYRGLSLNINPSNIIFNRIAESRCHVANFICLIAKQYIYATRCLGNQLSFNVLKGHIVKLEQIEKYIAIKNNRLAVHQKKWVGTGLQGDTIPLQRYINEYVTEMN